MQVGHRAWPWLLLHPTFFFDRRGGARPGKNTYDTFKGKHGRFPCVAFGELTLWERRAVAVIVQGHIR